MKVKCPVCNHVFYVEARASIGKGTRAGEKLKHISENKKQLLRILLAKSSPLSVREISKILYERDLKRITRGGKTKYWSYHDIQKELSVMVGAGLIQMTKTEIEIDKPNGEIGTKKLPVYWIEDRIKDLVYEIMKEGEITEFKRALLNRYRSVVL